MSESGRKVKTHTFNRRKYNIYFGPLKGIADVSRNPTLSMFVRTVNLSEQTILNTTIHEALHACNWDKSEKKVNRTANDISRFLWRLGYRKQERK